VPEGADDTARKGVVLGEDALAARGGDDGDIERFGKGQEGGSGRLAARAVTSEYDRVSSAGDRPGGGFEAPLVDRRRR